MKRRMVRTLKLTALGAFAALALGACDGWTIIVNWPQDTEPLIGFDLSWSGSTNLDLYMTYPNSNDTSGGHPAPNFTDPYYVPTDTLVPAGFFPEDASGRETVSYVTKKSSATVIGGAAAVELTNDAYDGGEDETLVVRGFAFDTNATTVSSTGATDIDGLPSGHTYTWVGVMELYVYADGSDYISESNGTTTNAELTVFYQGNVIGRYTFPTDTNVKGASVVRINCFYQDNVEYYQIVPDERVINSTTQIRSIGDAPAILTVAGNAR